MLAIVSNAKAYVAVVGMEDEFVFSGSRSAMPTLSYHSPYMAMNLVVTARISDWRKATFSSRLKYFG